MQVGNKVRLNSGGPLMTTEERGQNGKWYCVWFLNGVRQGGYFIEQTLEIVNDDSNTGHDQLASGPDSWMGR